MVFELVAELALVERTARVAVVSAAAEPAVFVSVVAGQVESAEPEPAAESAPVGTKFVAGLPPAEPGLVELAPP